jgi:hypothetical protein
MNILDEFQRRVDQYFQCGQRNEPGGRIILDLMRALRECYADRAQDQQRLFHYESMKVASVLDTLEDLSQLTSDELQSRIQSVCMWLREQEAMDPTREPGSQP